MDPNKPETDAERAQRERSYADWLKQEDAQREYKFPDAADGDHEDDHEGDDE